MKRQPLGDGGPSISVIGLGCMSFGGIFGPTDEAESFACLDAAAAAGVNFLDTANIYGMGVSETVIGRWLASRRADMVIATKAGITRDRGFDNSEAHLRSELEASLRRLGVERVDLFYIHRREQARPVEEVIETLKSLIQEGKIGGYGLSEVAPATLRRAHAIHPCRAVQSEYSLWTRQPELGLVQTCAALGVTFVPFSPLARGALGTPIADPATFGEGDFRRRIPRFHAAHWPENLHQIKAFSDFCASRGWAVPAVALAWVLHRAPGSVPIPGTRSAAHLAAWAAADQLALSPGDLAQIDRLLPPGWAHGDRYDDQQAANVERYC
jgi:aryl-alcohol dehydrogenase-like predicted oxidoreductase